MLRIFAFADFHNDEIALEKLEFLLKNNKYDYVLIAGDIDNNISYVENLISILKRKNAFYVPGNNDNQKTVEMMKDADLLIHKKRVEIKDGYNIVGFGFSNITPFNTPGEMKEEEMYSQISKLDINNKTILLTHCPPKGVLDKNFGCEAVRKIVEEKEPMINIFGHIHEIEGREIFHKTLCINLPPAFSYKFGVIEMEGSLINVYFAEF